jgi:Gnt-I system high-affinity gluconate transporter
MELAFVLIGIILLLLLIAAKVNPMPALVIVSVVTGLLLRMPLPKLFSSMQTGIASTLGSTVLVLAFGAMLGRLAEVSGAAQKLVLVLMRWFGRKQIQWAIFFTGILAGIPLFYNAGFVVLIPLVFAIAAATGLPLLYVGIPMAASLSVTHGFLPPHPGPVALTGIFKADVGTTMLYGLALSIPVGIVAGIIFPRLIIPLPHKEGEAGIVIAEDETRLPSAFKSFLIVLVPVLFIAIGTIGAGLNSSPALHPFFLFLQEPSMALLLSLAVTIAALRMPMSKAMDYGIEGVKSIAMIVMIIAAGGAFKQVLVDSNVAALIKESTAWLHLSPLFMGWMMAAIFRIALGSATVAALTASGMVAPFVTEGASPELMVLAVGAGSLMCSHVNDTGFWMFKEYFKISLRQTFLTWTVMESIISLLGIAGVLLLEKVIA